MTTEANPQDASVVENKQSPKESKISISEAGLLAGMSAAAYLLCFYYESGYADVFGIPTQLINVSLINLLICASIVISFGLAIFPLINSVSLFLPKSQPYLAFYVPRFVVLCVLPAIVFLMLPFSEWKYSLIFLAVPLLFALQAFVLPVITHRKKGGYLERFQAEDEAWLTRPRSFVQEVANRTGNTLFVVILLLIMGTVLINLAGKGKALKQIDFPVTNTQPEMVVLRIYGDNMICAPFDRKTREVSKTFSVLKIAEDPKLIINVETVGPLKSVNRLRTESVATPTPTSTQPIK